MSTASDAWGRVADDGTVYVRTTEGERVVGSWQAGSPDEALANASDPVLQAIPEADRVATLMARPDPAGLRFAIRLQGDHETVFFDW